MYPNYLWVIQARELQRPITAAKGEGDKEFALPRSTGCQSQDEKGGVNRG